MRARDVARTIRKEMRNMALRYSGNQLVEVVGEVEGSPGRYTLKLADGRQFEASSTDQCAEFTGGQMGLANPVGNGLQLGSHSAYGSGA